MSADPISGDDPTAQIDSLLLDPTRLRIAATLLPAGEVEFRFVRDRVGLTDSSLSKQIKTLSEHGLISSRRESMGPARRVWLRLTPDGRLRLGSHAKALRAIIGQGNGDSADAS